MLTFEELGNNFAKDEGHYYYNGAKTELNPADFQFGGERYVKDKKAIYCILKTKLKKKLPIPQLSKHWAADLPGINPLKFLTTSGLV